jgi:hypothetical protein
MSQEVPRFPERSKSSQAVVLRPLQDLDIFVEDSKSKEFYNVLMGRLLEGAPRFFSVIPLGDRAAVEAKAKTDNGPRLSVYLVDGDLDWVAGNHHSESDRLYVHQCYCVENYLLCPQAMTTVIHENNGTISEYDVQIALNWSGFCKSLEPLIDLFIEFAVAHALGTGIPTVSRGYSVVIEDIKGKPPQINPDKIKTIIDEVRESILGLRNEVDYTCTRSKIERRVKSLHNQLSIVSGKDFLLLIQNFEAYRITAPRMTTESIMLRLAKHCDLNQLSPIRLLCDQLTEEACQNDY